MIISPYHFFSIILLFIAVNVYGQSNDGLLIINSKSTLADPIGGEYSIDDILSTDLVANFTESAGKQAGGQANSRWLKLEIENPHDIPTVNLLEVGYPTLDYMDSYLVLDGKIISEQISGDSRPFYERTNLYMNNIIRIETDERNKYTLYLHVKGKGGNFNIPLHLYDVQVYHLTTNITMFELGTGVGILFLVLSYSLVLIILTPDKTYAYFASYIFFVMAFILCRSGAGLMYLWPNQPWMNDVVMHSSIFLSISASSLFANRFLNMKSISKNWSVLLKVEALITAAMGVMVISGVSIQLMPRLTVVGIIYNVLILATGIIAFNRGTYNARLYAIGIFTLAFFCALHIMSLYGIVSQSIFSFTFLRLGWYIEIIFLTIALTRTYLTALKEKQQLVLANANAERNIIIQRENLKRIEQELDEKNRKLLLKNLSEAQLDNLLSKFDDDHELKKKLDKVESLKHNSHERWEYFRVTFEQVHPNFFTQFQRKYPGLTPNDLRQLAYVKLNLSTKEIAELTNVSVQAVKIARNRLKKKLDISENLSDFIAQFDFGGE